MMRAVALVLACLALSGQARRVQTHVNNEDVPLAFNMPAGVVGRGRSPASQMSAIFPVVPEPSYSSSGKPLPTDGKPIAITELPYDYDALTGFTAGQLKTFYTDMHAWYVDMTNEHAPETSTLEELVKDSTGISGGPLSLYSAEAYSWDFFWKSLSPEGGGAPTGAIKDVITKSFGSYGKFVDDMRAAFNFYGIGWVWLVQNGEKLQFVSLASARNPGVKPILAMKVFKDAAGGVEPCEGAVNAAVKHLNWDFANANLDTTAKGVPALKGKSKDAFVKGLKPSQKKYLDELMAAR